MGMEDVDTFEINSIIKATEIKLKDIVCGTFYLGNNSLALTRIKRNQSFKKCIKKFFKEK